MSDQQKDKTHEDYKKKVLPPDPETLDTTDPQEKMQGPVSSVMQSLKESGEKNDEESKEEADKKKDKNT